MIHYKLWLLLAVLDNVSGAFAFAPTTLAHDLVAHRPPSIVARARHIQAVWNAGKLVLHRLLFFLGNLNSASFVIFASLRLRPVQGQHLMHAPVQDLGTELDVD